LPVPAIRRRWAKSSLSNIAPGGFQKYEDALFNSQYNPVAREINRQGDTQDRQLQAQLAQSGLASSGTGIGQIQQQGRERSAQLEGIASDAANRASVQRFGAEQAQAQFNAQQQQSANLANAGFNLQAQQQNADNILRGDVARSQNYLATIGLNAERAQQERASFLAMMGVAEQDLQRMDKFQQDTLGLLLNNWLQQAATIGSIGRESEGRGSGSTNSGGGGVAIGGGGGG
jgi:hypothetical protein